MKPVARALDILQGDKQVYMGYLLPTLTMLKRMLEYQAMKGLRICSPLVSALLDGIHKRYVHIMSLRLSSARIAVTAARGRHDVDRCKSEHSGSYATDCTSQNTFCGT